MFALNCTFQCTFVPCVAEVSVVWSAVIIVPGLGLASRFPQPQIRRDLINLPRSDPRQPAPDQPLGHGDIELQTQLRDICGHNIIRRKAYKHFPCSSNKKHLFAYIKIISLAAKILSDVMGSLVGRSFELPIND